ncbi:MAG: hypothetical protein Kow00108_21030 [Calditrichia bacterium]
MYLTPETRIYQEKMAEYCRTGKSVQIPGVREDRLHHYRRLISGVFENTLENAFPLTHQLLSQEEWEEMLRDFQAHHDVKASKLWLMPKEFYEFARLSAFGERFNRPYLSDLLYFEWMEIQLFTMADKVLEPYIEHGEMLDDLIYVNPEYEMIQLRYPVHKTLVHEELVDEVNAVVFGFRDVESGEVKFVELSPFFAFIINQIHHREISLKNLIEEMSRETDYPDKETIIPHLLPFVGDMFLQGLFLGYRRGN